MTETCSQVVALKFEDAALKIGSAGQPLKDMQIKIVDELGQEQPEKQVGKFYLRDQTLFQVTLTSVNLKNGQQMVGLKQATWAI